MVWGSREELISAYRQRRTFAGWREDVLRLFSEHGTFQREDGQIELKCPGEIEEAGFTRRCRRLFEAQSARHRLAFLRSKFAGQRLKNLGELRLTRHCRVNLAGTPRLVKRTHTLQVVYTKPPTEASSQILCNTL